MLYKLNKTNNKDHYEKVKRVSLLNIGWKESDLEKLILKNIQDFISSDDLMVIHNERPLQEEPDILALDSKGDLYIFELKRWSGKQENLLQVLKYGQLFGRSNYDILNEIYNKYHKNNQRVNLLDDHKSYFENKLSPTDFNQKQHFIIVANGIDHETVESIIYWRNTGLDINAIIYWVFEIADEYYIEFNMYSQIENYLEYEKNCYVLNTNKKSNEKYTKEMLDEKKAAAYYPGWREKIQKLQKGDTVFLYENDNGIIAYGTASGILNKCPCDGNEDYEYNMKLENFVKLKKPISAAEMKVITNQMFNFRQTMFSISEQAANKIKEAIDLDQK